MCRIIIADMLVGSAPQFGGVLPELFNRHDNPWWLSRAFVVRTLALVLACNGCWCYRSRCSQQTALPIPAAAEVLKCVAEPWAWHALRLQAGALVCGVIAPMLVPRNLATVSRFSRCSVAMILLLAGTITTLALTALAKVSGGDGGGCKA